MPSPAFTGARAHLMPDDESRKALVSGLFLTRIPNRDTANWHWRSSKKPPRRISKSKTKRHAYWTLQDKAGVSAPIVDQPDQPFNPGDEPRAESN
ncbi:hypothetical protein E4U56_008293 [Claviceps arundinis]|uniref:Uncharacterized protein n=1 Tax=Claviceps arundinis TaxID=1623583 RepID=A0A9P7SR76_9HYPO|nr:hypothetical protein E4U56_008293 [Claviceps arundinis]